MLAKDGRREHRRQDRIGVSERRRPKKRCEAQ